MILIVFVLQETISKHFKSIELHPGKFDEYLLGPEVGFTEVYEMKVPAHSTKGFQRPIKVYTKKLIV